jgi:hypothetical protein
MLKLSTTVLSAILALSFSQLAAAQSANTTSPNNPAATPNIEKDQARDNDRATVRSGKRSAAGSSAANRRSPNNPAATPDVRKDDSQHGFTNDTSGAAGGSTAASRSSPNNPAATPDLKRRQEQR